MQPNCFSAAAMTLDMDSRGSNRSCINLSVFNELRLLSLSLATPGCYQTDDVVFGWTTFVKIIKSQFVLWVNFSEVKAESWLLQRTEVFSVDFFFFMPHPFKSEIAKS